jgi:hypothetical protein
MGVKMSLKELRSHLELHRRLLADNTITKKVKRGDEEEEVVVDTTSVVAALEAARDEVEETCQQGVLAIEVTPPEAPPIDD